MENKDPTAPEDAAISLADSQPDAKLLRAAAAALCVDISHDSSSLVSGGTHPAAAALILFAVRRLARFLKARAACCFA